MVKRLRLDKRTKKLSTLLRIAVEDAKAVARSKKYVLRMNDWHHPQPNGTCAVCMAGAVMARRLGADAGVQIWPDAFSKSTANQLDAIDSLRAGYAVTASCELGISLTDAQRAAAGDYRSLIDLHYDFYTGRAPWRVYIKGANILEEVGL